MNQVRINCVKCHNSFANDREFDKHIEWCNPIPKNDVCPKSKRVDGKGHSFVFDGDDPYVVCAYCKERRDAISGRVIEPIKQEYRAKTFQELEKRLGGFSSSQRFSEWLDEHGYKTFPDMPPYVS